MPASDYGDPSQGGFDSEHEAWEYAAAHFCDVCKELFESKEFFSGSAFQLINAKISDDEFVKMKSTVGDIDTMVSKEKEESVKRILDSIKDETFGDLTFIGYKKSAGQFITLWFSKTLDHNIQIDLELTEFDESGFPTKWSKFAHSSSLEDMQSGIKGGVFSKLFLRALTGKNLKEIPIKTSKGIVKKKSSELAFSVGAGLREKYKKVQQPDGTFLYQEIPTKDSKYETDVEKIIQTLFGIDYKLTRDELKDTKSFIGLIELTKKYIKSKDELSNIISAFAYSLFSEKAQVLYKGVEGKKQDLEEKLKALNYISDQFEIPLTDSIKSQIEVYKEK